ncbi:MAG: alpha/beta hydrolase [Candidatus Dormibacteraeota bacterium]|nr:alpha/beta hydrolase [Candidatus Dormibacteraeota bacterium]
MSLVKSTDGTEIAYDVAGSGPPVILVDGALGYRMPGVEGGLADLLAEQLSVYSYDRRGRGDSGYTKPSNLQREIEDIDALIAQAGGSAGIYGISSGGALALEAAIALGPKVTKLAVYEIPYDSSEAGVKAWSAYRTRLAELVDAGDPSGAVELFMRFVGASDEGVAGMRNSPMWPRMESVGATLPLDAEALGDRRVPSERTAGVTAETLVIDGAASLEHMPFMRVSAEALTDAIPRARHVVLEGQSHDLDPAVIAPVLSAFFADQRAA